jgi:hypothetical protein
MKKMILTLLAVFLVLAGVLPTAAPAQAAVCGTSTVVNLLAGQTIPAGTVTISNDASNLYVTISTQDGWLLKQTHLSVRDSLASIPQTKNGNPKIGNFEFQTSHNPYVTEFTYTIPKSIWVTDAFRNVTVAAHAEVVKVDGNGSIVASETGWGQGDQFNPKGSWAMYISYTWQECTIVVVDSKTETAFAYGAGKATCFDQYEVSNRWGWTNGPLSEGSYTFDLYAGAAQCNTSKGTKVGTLSVNYNNGTATITYQMVGSNPTTNLPYTLTETHLYVGSAPLPSKDGEYTVAPGQYPYINAELNTTSRTYTVSGLTNSIYIVAHGTVAGFPK